MNYLNVKGVRVPFPYKPYQCQVIFMERVIQCLNESYSPKNERNALLESPTGTGKTISLLCSALAWLNQNKHELARRNIFPKIVYSTRTHSQVSQIISELQGCAIIPKLCVLASRKQLCVKFDHKERAEMSNSSLGRKCYEAISSGKCEFYREEFDSSFARSGRKSRIFLEDGIMDIEDLCNVGRTGKYCPYFFQRSLQLKLAEIVVLPYNYLVNPSIKRRIDLDLTNSIVIFDEAHNLEKICESLCSFKFDSLTFVNAIEELGVLVNHYLKDYQSVAYDWKRKFAKFAELLVEVQRRINKDYKKGSLVDGYYIQNGDYFGKIIEEELDMSHESFEDNLKLLGEALRQLRRFRFPRLASGLINLKSVLDQFFSFSTLNMTKMKEYFRFLVKEKGDELVLDPLRNQYYLKEQSEFFGKEQKLKEFEFYCLSPSIAMNQLINPSTFSENENEGSPRCVILTSGTLSPLSFFPKSFKVKFPIKLENRHVVDPSRLEAMICKAGPGNIKLSSDFNNRNNKEYLSELSDLLINTSRLVPNGILVFFPSFRFLNSCVSYWQNSNYRENSKSAFDLMGKYKKIFIEPSNSSGDKRRIRSFIRDYERSSENNPGSMLLAVCRGRLSEGLDFSDNKCRLVIVVGIPYPPKHDIHITIKEKFYVQNGSAEWYSRQASSAINQAIGRVIRHKNDYGCIMFCDYRYERMIRSSSRDSGVSISRWILPQIHRTKSFGDVQVRLKRFFGKWKKICKGQTKMMKATIPISQKIILGMEKVRREVVFENSFSPKAGILSGQRNTGNGNNMGRNTGNGNNMGRNIGERRFVRKKFIPPRRTNIREVRNDRSREINVIAPPSVQRITKPSGTANIREMSRHRDNTNIIPPPPLLEKIAEPPRIRITSEKVEKKRSPATNDKNERKKFLSELKESLSDNEYKMFKNLLVQMREQKRDFKDISNDLIELLGRKKRGFVRSFISHLPEKKRLLFQEVWDHKTELGKRKRIIGNEKKGYNSEFKKISNERKRKRRKTDKEIPIESSFLMKSPQSPNAIGSPTTRNAIICTICGEEFSNPHTSKCGHVFCLRCWKNWLNQKKNCPICKSLVNVGELKKIFL